MSRKRLLFLMVAGAFVCLPVMAQTPPKDNSEIAYRAALGRGDDIKLLIKGGANPNSVDSKGIPILLVASGRKDAEALNAVQALVEGGANINIKDTNGQTALYYAARNGKADVVSYLLNHKIDYYSIDKNGDIARTIAFRADHNDIVTLMDNFVKNQTFQAQTGYMNAQNLLKEQQEKEKREEAKRAAEEKKKRAEEERKQKLAREKEIQEYNENLKKLPDEIYDISYNACAFQYWAFAYDAYQTTELSDEDVEQVIENHKQAVKEKSLEVMKMFKTNQNYVNQIINPSKQAIYNVLNRMPSRTYRKERGVGTMEDVATRCDKIAKNWTIGKPKSVPDAKKAAPVILNKTPPKKAPAPRVFPEQVQKQPVGLPSAVKR